MLAPNGKGIRSRRIGKTRAGSIPAACNFIGHYKPPLRRGLFLDLRTVRDKITFTFKVLNPVLVRGKLWGCTSCRSIHSTHTNIDVSLL